MPAVFAHDREVLRPRRSRWIACADVAEVRAGAHLADAAPHRFVRDVDEALRVRRDLADGVHAAGVAVEAVLDDRDVDVDDVAAASAACRLGMPWQTT